MSEWCTFSVAGHWCGVELSRVREVALARPVTRVPGAHDAVLGLLSLRGEILPAIDLRRRLGLPAAETGGVHVVVDDGDDAASLVVDDIGDVVTTDDARLQPAPHAALAAPAADAVRCAYAMEQGLLLALDTVALLRLSPQDVIPPRALA